MKRSRSTPGNMNENGDSDDDNEDDSYAASYHQMSLQVNINSLIKHSGADLEGGPGVRTPQLWW